MEYAIQLLENELLIEQNYYFSQVDYTLYKNNKPVELSHCIRANEQEIKTRIEQLEKAIEILKIIPADFDYKAFIESIKSHYAEQLKPVEL